jgi:hypothetical protein
LKKNGGLKRIPKCGEFTPSVRAALNVNEGPRLRLLDSVVDKILDASNRPNLGGPRLPTVLPVADMLFAAVCSPEQQKAAGDYCLSNLRQMADTQPVINPSGPFKGIPLGVPTNLPARIILGTMHGAQSFSKNFPNTTHVITAPFQVLDYMFVAPVRYYFWGDGEPGIGSPQACGFF